VSWDTLGGHKSACDGESVRVHALMLFEDETDLVSHLDSDGATNTLERVLLNLVELLVVQCHFLVCARNAPTQQPGQCVVAMAADSAQ
jgi:hypothetical protein